MATLTDVVVTTESALDADITAINSASTSDPAGTNYLILLMTDLTLTANIQAIKLAPGHPLTVEGLNSGNDFNTALIDGDGSHRGFVVNSGSVAFSNLDLQGMTAPGGSGGLPGGGGALYVGTGASVSANGVAFSGDTANGGTPAGGAVFLAAGGSLALAGGSIAGSGHNGLFIQGNNSVTLDALSVTGVIADQTGSHLGTGAGTVITQGAVTLGAANDYTGGTHIQGALTLLAPGAAGTGAISFTSASGETLVAGAGDAPANKIDGFVLNASGRTAGDVIDLQGIGAPTSAKLTAGNHLTVAGSTGTVTLNLDPAQNYAADAFVLQPGAAIGSAAGTLIQLTPKSFLVASEADFNAALAAIDVGGKFAAPHVAYTIKLTAGFWLSGDLDAVNLGSTDSLVINGSGFALDGAGTYRGLFAYAGPLTVENLTIKNAVARGGAGGTGAVPGGGGGGLGGGLFVATGASVTLANVNFTDNQAIGGAAGATGAVGIGGGGGLGGAGGAAGGTASIPRNGGGGGIGVAATGGSLGGGGAGIVVGAAGGNSGTGNHPVGGAGGIEGGGGGAAGVTVTSGSGRGGGGSRTYPGLSGSGGVGGSFGGGGTAEGAGFGGGGANSAGGWGGGGSGASAGGFGGGAASGGAGGGLGAGGAVFVQQGGALTFVSGGVSGDTIAGGAGNGGQAGSAYGSGLFLGGGNRVVLDPGAGQTLTVAGVIADTAGSGGTGTSGLTLNGVGTVLLPASNSFRGGIFLQSGALSLQAVAAAGSGAINFAYGAHATLIVGAGNVPANTIIDFLPGSSIDLQGIGTAGSATLGTNDVLNILGGTVPVALTLDPAQNFTGESFHVAGDGHGGTWLTASDIQNDFPPFVAGAGTVSGNDHAVLDPLAGVTVIDLVAGKTVTVTAALSSTLNGALSHLGGGSYNATTGVYSVSGTPAAVTTALDGLVFTPTIHQVAPGGTVTTLFHLSATDGLMTSAAKTETVKVKALNDPPAISGVPGSLVEGYWNVPLAPFPIASVSDPDLGATETVTFSLGTNIGGINGDTLSLSMPGMTLTNTGVGTYKLSPGTPAQVTAATDALKFTGVPDPSVPGYKITYVGMSVSDGIAPSVIAQAEVLTGLPIFSGTVADQTITDGHSIKPFSTVSVTDSAGLSIQGFTIVLYDSSSNYSNAADANGMLSGADLTKSGVGTYTLPAGSPATVSAELDALSFTPAVSNTAVITDFLLSAFDGTTTADNSDTSVIASPPAAASVSALSVPATFAAADHLGAMVPASANSPGSTAGLPTLAYDDGTAMLAGSPPMSELHW